MRKEKTLRNLAIILTVLILANISAIAISEISLTGNPTKEVPDRHTHTKAICDEENFCQDYKIKCKNGTVHETSPISGATVQHSENWEDPRENPKELC